MKSINYLHTSHDTYYVQQGQEGGVTLIALSFSQVSTRTHIHTQMPATARKRRKEKDEIDLFSAQEEWQTLRVNASKVNKI